MKTLLRSLLLLPLLWTSAFAQTAPTPDPVSIYMASVPLAVTGASARVVLPSASVSAAALTISNDGASDVCIAKGTVTVVATNACLSGASTSVSFLIPAGRTITIFKNSTETYLAAIGAGASTLHIYQSNGPVWIQGIPAGAGGGGGAVTQGTSPWTTQGAGATGAAVSGNPFVGGCRAATSAPTAVTNGQAVACEGDPEGKIISYPYALKENQVRGSASSTDGNAHTIISSAGGSLKNYITSVECGNTSATTINVTFNDSAATVMIVPANGGNNAVIPEGLATAAATVFQFTSSTGVSTVTCNAQGHVGL